MNRDEKQKSLNVSLKSFASS